MKHVIKISISILCILSIAYSCKKTSNTVVVKNKAYVAPVVAEVTSIILKKFPQKEQSTFSSSNDWDFNQFQEDLGPDVLIDILDSIPYYCVYQGGYVRFNLKNDSLPKNYGHSETFKIPNLKNKYNLLMLDWDKNTESEVMALLPFRLSDYQLTKPSFINLFNNDSSAKVSLTILWH